MRIIEQRRLKFAEEMATIHEYYNKELLTEKMKIEIAQSKQSNQRREEKAIKDIHKFVDRMIKLVRDESTKYNSRDLKITMIFEK